jgi:peptidyl-prolyl cis-trans isomerase B (cyclophilin B)
MIINKMEFFMLKFIILFITVFSLTLSDYAQTKDYVKPIPDNSSISRPQYLITATQNGKRLGEIVIELFPDVAPLHVKNFDSLVSIKFFDGIAFHRVIPGFVVQGGDPNSKNNPDRLMWGEGDSTQKDVPAEFSKLNHKRGVLSAARESDNINSANSQFFICVADVFRLDGKYSIYGQVLKGMDVVDAIVNMPRDARDNPNEKVEMKIVRIKN